MGQIRLLLDEDVWPGLGTLLRQSEYDVIHVYDVGRGGLSDFDQLAYAAQEGRAILTHNTKDFIPLAVTFFFDERHHAGLILSPQIEKGELARRMLTLLQSLSAEEIANSVRYLSDFK